MNRKKTGNKKAKATIITSSSKLTRIFSSRKKHKFLRINQKNKRVTLSNAFIEKKKPFDKNRFFILSISLLIVAIIILSNTVFMFHDSGFYYKEYEKLGVYRLVDKEKAHNMTEDMLSYLSGSATELNNNFSEREKAHLKDVKNLVFIAKAALFISSAIAVWLFYILYKRIKKQTRKQELFGKKILFTLSRIFIYQGIIAGLFLIFAFLFRNAFSFLFIMFHKLMFTNDLWLLNPEFDKLILLLPEQFFVHATAAILIRGFLVSALLLLVGLFLKWTGRKNFSK